MNLGRRRLPVRRGGSATGRCQSRHLLQLRHPLPTRHPLPIRLLLLLLAGLTLAVPARAGGAAPASATGARTVSPASAFTPEAYRGRVLLVDFWASWCKPCTASLPWLAELQARHGAEGLSVVTINLDSDLANAADLLAELPAGVEVYHDADHALAASFDLQGMPSAYLFDRDGRRCTTHVGFLPADADAREREIVALLHTGEGGHED